ncbi:MAG: hypothetical protein AAFU73_10655 [Planctomycetota bacterium]
MATAQEVQTPEVTRARERFAADVLQFDLVLGRIAGFASSSLGRRRVLGLAPRGDDEARAALARTGELAWLLARGEEPGLAGVTDALPPGPVERLDEARIAAIRDLVSAGRRLAAWGRGLGEVCPQTAALLAAVPDASALEERIDAILDERGRVRDDASPRLAGLRSAVSELSARIQSRLRDVMARGDVRACLSDGSVHRRSGRPVLAVKAKQSGRVKGITHDRSSSGESVFIEPSAVVELGNRLAEAEAGARREIDRVLVELSRAVLDQRALVEGVALRVGELEVALSAAKWARAVGARAALLPGDEGASEGLLLRGARHPLLIAQVEDGELDAVTPIDLRLGVDFDMLLITGPNTGGKTLALKTAGLFALMTRAGLPVPCDDGTTVPLFDRVCADIGDEQEIRQNLSTFASHLVRVSAALEDATPRSLVLLDELGGGTDPDEGGALGTAVLEELLARRVPTLVSTHIGKLKEFAYRHARAENACAEFDHESLAPRYTLMLGTPGESCALVIAQRVGLEQRVCDVAAERLERRGGELEALMGDVRSARMAAEATRQEAEAGLAEARGRLERAKKREVELEARAEQLEKEAQKGIEERVRDAMRSLERARRVLEQVPAEARREAGEILDRMEAELTGASLSERREEFLSGLGKGSLVYLPRYRQRVIVHKLDREKRELTAKMGSMKVKVSFDEVTPYEAL